MALKKAAVKAVKKSGASTTAMVPWTEKFGKYAVEGKAQVANIGTGGVGITFGRGKIEAGGQIVAGGKLECVIVGSCALNRWNRMAYDPNNKQPPDCYAFAVVSDDPEMKPHAAATDKQAPLCSECEKNVFGTAITGKGKACSNTIRMGIIIGKDAEDAASISTAELYTAGVSPTNLTRYKKYLDAVLEEYERPLWAVVTEISSHDDDKTQIRLEFKFVSLIDDDDILQALEKRYLKVQDALQKPFPAPSDKKPAPKSSQKFAAKKQTARR
jgi:hypothetical protein